MDHPTCPAWWPLPDGRPIGDKRAPELLAYVRDRSVPVIDIARAYLGQRHPGQPIRVRGAQPAAIARVALARTQTGIPVATVSVGKGNSGHVIRIILERSGEITARLSRPTEPVMRSVSMYGRD
jgi:hypothetical protein